ncbi:hypothetical protein IJ182_05700 [bacterium]|nr:hypothetical protein [bacterium]
MFRFYLIIISFLFINLSAYSYYDMTTPVEGESIANNELQFLVIKKAYKVLAPKNPTCTDYHVKNTQLLHYPYDVKKNKKGKYVKGYWEEIWSFDACGQVKQLPIKFYIKKNNTVFETDDSLLQ